jgi:acyl-CoA synthetase (NDP forming)
MRIKLNQWRTNIFDFAVGISRQPLPTGNHFAIVTNASGPGIRATDATTLRGLDLTTLRPETIESKTAKLPPTANVLSPGRWAGTFSTTERARIGLETKITNGVKQKLPGARLLGVESFP